MKREVVVQSVALSTDGVELTFMVLPDDVRSQAQVVSSRHVAIAYATPAGLGELARDLQTLVDRLAETFLDKLPDLPVYEAPATEQQRYQPTAVDDDDDDIGMGDGR